MGGGCHEGPIKDKIASEIEYWLQVKQIKNAKVLFVPFAKDEADWEKTVDKFKSSIFKKLFEEGKISISTAKIDITTLPLQLSSADIIFFSGGTESNLIKLFKKSTIPSKNKIIIGTSAGTNFLSTFYFSNDRLSVERGLGMLPINTICHFSPDKKERVIQLSTQGPYPVFFIFEDEYISLIF